jgi:4'-phosphopantetheinyl transferase
MVDIYITSFEKQMDDDLFFFYRSFLSQDLIDQNSRYIRWQNRHSHLLGKLLLLKGLKDRGIEKDIWNHVQYTSHQRPYLTLDNHDFNISHSGKYVVCAVGENVTLGIDIEENKNVNFKNFHSIMNEGQWEAINNAVSPLKEFYKYWTVKESVIKADGRGFHIPLHELSVENNTVRYEDKVWYLQELDIDSGYNVTLATNHVSDFRMHHLDFDTVAVWLKELATAVKQRECGSERDCPRAFYSLSHSISLPE